MEGEIKIAPQSRRFKRNLAPFSADMRYREPRKGAFGFIRGIHDEDGSESFWMEL